MKQPEILFDLHSGNKSESNPHILKDDFRRLQSRHKNYQQVWVKERLKNNKAGCTVTSGNSLISNVYLTIHQFSLLKPKQLV